MTTTCNPPGECASFEGTYWNQGGVPIAGPGTLDIGGDTLILKAFQSKLRLHSPLRLLRLAGATIGMLVLLAVIVGLASALASALAMSEKMSQGLLTIVITVWLPSLLTMLLSFGARSESFSDNDRRMRVEFPVSHLRDLSIDGTKACIVIRFDNDGRPTFATFQPKDGTATLLSLLRNRLKAPTNS